MRIFAIDMRWTSCIFSLYMLFLAFYPCLDNEPVIKDATYMLSSQHTQSASTSTPESDNGEHEQVHCSPFCMCHCCHTHIVVSDLGAPSALHLQLSLPVFWVQLWQDKPNQPLLRPPIHA